MGNFNSVKACCNGKFYAPQSEVLVESEKPVHQESGGVTYRNSEMQKDVSLVRDSLYDSVYKDLSFDTSRVQKLEKAVHYGKLLRLKVLSSSTLEKGHIFTINPLGHDASSREKKDGFVYFGCKKRSREETGEKGEIVNDIVIPSLDKVLAEKHRGQHFCISYDLYGDCYFIKDLAIGFGTFVKILTPLLLKDNFLIHMGDNFILVNIVSPVSPENTMPRLRLKLFGAPCTGDVFYFNASDYQKSTIHIGRVPKCEIQIEDSLISKVQATLYFSELGWVLVDGEYEANRSSTNGTWLYLNESYEMYNDMVFKSNHTLFQVSIV